MLPSEYCSGGQGLNELAMLRNASEYSPPRSGGVDAAGVVSSAKLFRPEHLAELTTITALRYRARASRSSAASLVCGIPW